MTDPHDPTAGITPRDLLPLRPARDGTSLAELVATPDGMLLGRCKDEPDFRRFLGSVDDLLRIIHGLAPVAELDGDELGYLVARVAEIKRRR